MDSDSRDNSIPNEEAHSLSHSDPAKKPNNSSIRNPFTSHSQERVPQKEEPENVRETSTENKGDFVIKKNLNNLNAAARPNATHTLAKNPFGAKPEPPKEEEGQYKNPFKAMAEKASKNPPTTQNGGSPDANENRHSSPLPSNKTVKASESKSAEGGPSIKLESLGFSADELLAGEVLVTSIRCTVMLIQYPTVVSPGLLVISNYRLMFKPDLENFFKRYPLKSDYLKIPLGFILKIDRAFDKRELSVCYIDVYSKDGRTIRLKIAEKLPNESHSIIQYLSIYSFPEKKEYFFAFYFNKAARELEDKYQGWKIYDIQKEFKRQGIDFVPLAENGAAEHSPLAKYKIIDNRFFRLSPTYPPLLLVPSKMSDQALQTSSKFRTKERLPVITYYYKKAGTYLSRSSQSKPGIYQSRCVEDELLLRYLGDHNYDESTDNGGPTDINLNIYDARPYLNAVANKVHGKGYEDTKYYRNCEIDFMDIDNIHHVREAHRKLQNMCFSSDASNPKWYSQLEATNWLELISLITSAASKVAQSLRKGRNCLVHCSDGWDRTAQILTLAQIMLDPYFRTIEGFEVLIMKDWVSFGHQFSLRMGHGSKNSSDDQRSPVFLQFLDCVQQLLHQYPFAFEFNDTFLSDIAYHAYSCQFGTFLCNTYQEVILYQLESRTISVWSYLNSQKERYLNPYYDQVYEHSSLILRPSTHLKYLRLWEEYFLYYSWLAKPNYSFSHEITFCKDFYDFMYRKEKKKATSLQEEVRRLKKVLKDAGIEDPEEVEQVEVVAEEEKREEEEEAPEKVINLEGDKDQIQAKEIEEEEVVKLVEKHEKVEAVTPKNEVMGADDEKIAEFEP